eukprot:TRINITY_DN62463_c0_g1_i1.p2 TRINITY_DN62463_c0_g1~~TRINITY_DN62463_c0_g1_i1.p2  ORF type:complete len:201 (+),score=29.44 TRINITY_DN62463_c0_g1_i1:164-766(+)
MSLEKLHKELALALREKEDIYRGNSSTCKHLYQDGAGMSDVASTATPMELSRSDLLDGDDGAGSQGSWAPGCRPSTLRCVSGQSEGRKDRPRSPESLASSSGGQPSSSGGRASSGGIAENDGGNKRLQGTLFAGTSCIQKARPDFFLTVTEEGVSPKVSGDGIDESDERCSCPLGADNQGDSEVNEASTHRQTATGCVVF